LIWRSIRSLRGFLPLRRCGARRALVHKGAALDPALDRLEALCDGAAHLVGHNILRHDLPHLVANRARLAGLGAAPIDTLWLNPLAFPRNPYHHLVKHYQDGRLQVGHVNDPEQDARLALQVLADQIAAFTRLAQEAPDALLAYHHLTTRGEASAGFDALFQFLRGCPPDEAAAHAAIRRLLDGRACNHRLDQTLGRLSDPRNGWPMAYALSWISVAGGDSVMPPWVRLQFPQAGRIVRHLRDTNCGDPACAWCAEKNNPNARWNAGSAFRPSARSLSMTWAAPCRSASWPRRWRANPCWASCPPAPANRSATRSRRCRGSTRPGR
jgi:ATP-dependent DNA helicase RecQ